MKPQFALGVLTCALFLFGCEEGELTTKPENKVEPVQVKLSPSDITISAKINLASAQSVVESKLPTSPINMPRRTNDHCKRIYISALGVKITKWLSCEYWGGLEKRGPFTLSGSGDSLTASVPIHFWASARASGIQESTEANVTAFLSAKPKLTSNWELKLNPDASFRWDSHPEIKLFGVFPVGIQDALTGPMNEQIQKQVNLIASQIEGTPFRDRAAALWDATYNPIRLSSKHDIWVRIGMQEARFSGVNIADNILKANIGVKATTEIFMGAEPSPLPSSSLPKLNLENAPSAGFNIALPVAISYASMSDLLNQALKKGQKWAPLPDYPNVLVTIKKAEVYPSEGALAVRIDFVADLPNKLFDTSGTVFLSGTPVVDDDKKEFAVENISFTSQTNNNLTNIISKVMRSNIENRISDALKISYKKQFDDLLSESNVRINHDFGNGIVSQGTLTSGKLLAISLNKDVALIETNVSGKLEISYGL